MEVAGLASQTLAIEPVGLFPDFDCFVSSLLNLFSKSVELRVLTFFVSRVRLNNPHVVA